MSAAFGQARRQCASDRDSSVAGAPNPVTRSQTGWSKRNLPQILTAYSIVSAPGAPQDEALVTPRRCKAGSMFASKSRPQAIAAYHKAAGRIQGDECVRPLFASHSRYRPGSGGRTGVSYRGVVSPGVNSEVARIFAQRVR